VSGVAVNEAGGCPDLDAARRGDAPPPPWFDPATLIATIAVTETVTYAVR
jgi:hypothetical protein